MRYDPELRKTTSLGFQDPRQSGRAAAPRALARRHGRGAGTSIGKYHTDAQLQQNPAPRSGIIFARKDWKFWKALPELDETVISVDCTFKDLESSDYVAIQAWGRKGANHYLRRRLKERLSFSATVDAIRSFSALFPDHAAILIEDKANGSAVIETLQSQIGGIIPVNPDGGKVARAYAMQPEQEAGNVWSCRTRASKTSAATSRYSSRKPPGFPVHRTTTRSTR
jgi:predicted phage terminase large subunit-like protein